MELNRLTKQPRPPANSREWEGDMFRLLVENVRDYAIFVVDEERRILTWSAGAERLLGYMEHEIIGQTCDRFFTEEDREAHQPEREVESALATGRGADDRWHLRKDGTRFWCSGVMTPLHDGSGQLRGLAKIMRDLTDKKLAEERLLVAEARFNRLSDANILGIGVRHADGRILSANDEYLRILGHSRDELDAGQVWWSKLTPPESQPLDEAALAEAFRTGACTPYEKEYVRANDGQRIAVLIAYTTILDAPEHLLAYVIDLTARKKVEQELRQANKNKDEFLAVLGHELRNPLAPMFNAVHIMRHAKRASDDALSLQSLNMIERQVRHMTRLVDDLLEVARITLGKVELKPDKMELHPVIRNALETTRPLMEQRRHQVHVDIAGEPMWLKADALRVEQMLLNLLNNAAKYTEPGGAISLRVYREGQFAVIAVLDNGIGMDAQTLPRIFEPFAQAERAHGYAQGGLGVGLTLVRRFAELHGGTVSAYSAGLGTGSELTLKLPMLHASPDASATKRREANTASKLRVLVVDDNTDSAESMRVLLQFQGHEVLEAHTGPSAVQAALRWKPEVVLLDIGLPGLDGYQVAEALRKDPSTAGLIIIAMTGYGQQQDVERAQQAGFDRHMVKPVDPTMLADILAKVSGHKRSTWSGGG